MQTAHAKVTQLLDQIRAVSNSQVIQRASDQIEVICSAYMEPDQAGISQSLGLQGNKAQIFDLLHKKMGAGVSRLALFNACHHVSDDTNLEVVDVQVSNLRKALIGTKFEGKIKPVWRVGYMLEAEPDPDHPQRQQA